ncbi:hypothetical protein GCM10010201_04020 [Pilimelia columellifera subsp. columellifera]|uniref:Uncharacterized protein n=1 Tax=Pilimelia columellifera subsp. columellifera TaxID=706583 RepID=A0ABN3N0R9_9ACTN
MSSQTKTKKTLTERYRMGDSLLAATPTGPCRTSVGVAIDARLVPRRGLRQSSSIVELRRAASSGLSFVGSVS